MEIELKKPNLEEWELLFKTIENNQGVSVETDHGEYFVDYFTNVLPPIFWGKDYVLCSEPYSHDSNGKGMYTGIYKRNGKYYAVIATVIRFTALRHGSN